MVITSVKHGGQSKFLALMFRINEATFDRTIKRMFAIVYISICKELVLLTDNRYTIDKLHNDGYVFHPFLSARYATEVTFNMTNIPSGNNGEAKPYYSRKHGLVVAT